jgi:hypothetical protein
MATHSVSLAPNAVIEYSDRDDLPVLSTYCAELLCCPSNPCDACVIAARHDCDVCRKEPSTAVLRPAGLPVLATCFDCALADLAERAVSRG